ncbi:hypothetical protein RchiOBHm_Chr2g0101711 [Rosa chinensis]|uniref:Uncharacterized protein n=1 Tax=Rosa chinensis TaxID=74649 RepID=A0A2P6RMH1_ROSCH|nr:hypothetical protein RchiOBHm_Chr2g0101711 [Rosa chinensis]
MIQLSYILLNFKLCFFNQYGNHCSPLKFLLFAEVAFLNFFFFYMKLQAHFFYGHKSCDLVLGNVFFTEENPTDFMIWSFEILSSVIFFNWFEFMVSFCV